MSKSTLNQHLYSVTGRVCVLAISLFIGTTVNASDSHFFTSFVNISADSTDDVLLVDKSRQEMYILRSSAPFVQEIVRKYRVTTGRIIGNKETEGDLKTPEGIYRIVDVLWDEVLLPKYGPRAFVLDYPNQVDRLLNRTGSGIWIHGRDEEIRDYLTEGCVSLNNENLLDLEQFINLRQTRVIIEEALRDTTPKAYHRWGDRWRTTLGNWADAWEQGDLDDYFGFYSEQFRDGSQSLQEFKTRKRYLERVYSWKTVDVRNVQLLFSSGEIKLSFDQEYFCPNFLSRGTKTLTFMKEDTAWRIVSEDYTRDTPTIPKERFLSDFVERWSDAWASGDMERYIALYDTTFRSGEYDYFGWQEYKTRVFDETTHMSIRVADLEFRSTGYMEWTVTFKQDYRSPSYRDYGKKTLVITGRPNAFTITHEEWRPLAGDPSS